MSTAIQRDPLETHACLLRVSPIMGGLLILITLAMPLFWNRRSPIKLLLIICLYVASGCAMTGEQPVGSGSDRAAFEPRCRPIQEISQEILFPKVSELPDLRASQIAELSASTGFSPPSVESAHAIGVLDLITQIPALEQAARQQKEAKEELQETRNQIVNRIVLGSFQANSLNAEITCEVERASELADYLQERNESRARLLTIIAVVTGGLAGIAVGGLTIDDQTVSSGIAGILGGVISTAFGSAALFQNTQHNFKHPRNLLRELWEPPSSPAIFPEVMWRFLNRPLEEDPKSSLRTVMIARWRRDGRLGEPGSKLEETRSTLLLGDGGEYSLEDLRARAQMLNMVQAQVSLVSQYLERFLREVLSRGRVR